jgi:hypothetical protein
MNFTTEPTITFETIDNCMARLALDAIAPEETLIAQTPEARIAQLAKVFAMIRPLLPLLAVLPIPRMWRIALTVFFNAIEAVVPEVSASFKAGRDLEE